MSQPINVLLALMIVLSFILSIVLHNRIQVLVATWLGDTAARSAMIAEGYFKGSLDPLGVFLALFLAFSPAAGPVGLGWGKPVVPDPWKFKKIGHNQGVFLVAFTGIIWQVVIALVVSMVALILPASFYNNSILMRVPQFLIVFAITSMSVGFFEVLPLYPLDMFQIVYALLPGKSARKFAKSGPYGQYIILAFFFLLPFLANITHLSAVPVIGVILNLSDDILYFSLSIITSFASMLGSSATLPAILYIH